MFNVHLSGPLPRAAQLVAPTREKADPAAQSLEFLRIHLAGKRVQRATFKDVTPRKPGSFTHH
jgi:hypothetical protein